MKYSVVRNIGPELLDAITHLIDAARAHDDHNPLGEHKWLERGMAPTEAAWCMLTPWAALNDVRQVTER